MYYQQSQLWFYNLVVHTEFGYQTFDACISMRQKSFFSQVAKKKTLTMHFSNSGGKT